jgi:hypothetical protein
VQIDLKVVKDGKLSAHGMGMFCIVRDEIYFLPFLLDHYRRIGIDHFLFYDDKSSDGSRELLEAQPDCAVVTSDVPFGAIVKKGVRYVNVLKRMVPGTVFGDRWVLTVDADEFLLLPEPFVDLKPLCAAIAQQGGSSAVAALVDFYPEKLSMRNYSAAWHPMKLNRFCDRGPLFEWPPHRRQPFMFDAGIRYRLGEMLFQRHRDEYLAIFDSHPHVTPGLWKVPLLNLASGHWLVTNHSLNVPPFLGLQMVLAHFKFYPGLDKKIAYALRSKAYYANSREYRMLERAVHYFCDESLLCDQTIEYKSLRDLEQANLLYPLRSQG